MIPPTASIEDFTLQQKNIPHLMPGAEPIFFKGGSSGILFFHGFTGSPYEGKDFAATLSGQGYTVWVPLLPGHGTKPQDLMEVTWQDWFTFARQCLLKLKSQCDKVIVSGQSMGGSLALNLSAVESVDAVLSLAGAAFLKDWRLKLLPIARRFLHYQYKSRGPDVSLKEVKKNSASYHKYPLRSIDELLQLLAFTRQNLSRVSAPLLLIHSKRDHTVTYANMDYIYTRVSSSIKQKRSLQNSRHIISVDVEKEKVFRWVSNFLEELQLTP